MTNHTPGPWTKTPLQADNRIVGYVILGADGRYVAEIMATHGGGGRPRDEMAANAQLIASAPNRLVAREAEGGAMWERTGGALPQSTLVKGRG